MTLYEMKFTTWENDGDDYNTINHFLMSQKDVIFYTELANKFVSCNSSDQGMGNEEYDSEDIDYLIEDILANHPDISPEIRGEWQILIGTEYGAYDKLCKEILSTPVQYDYGFCRVVDSVQVNEIKVGYWIEVNGKKVVLKECKNNNITYAYSDYQKDTNGQVNIFKLEWKTATCNLNDFITISEPDEVSLKVIKYIE